MKKQDAQGPGTRKLGEDALARAHAQHVSGRTAEAERCGSQTARESVGVCARDECVKGEFSPQHLLLTTQ